MCKLQICVITNIYKSIIVTFGRIGTRLGECLLCSTFLCYFFPKYTLCINFDKKWIWLHFWQFFHKFIWSPCSWTALINVMNALKCYKGANRIETIFCNLEPMLWFFQYFRRKILRKKLAFLTRNKDKFWKKLIITLVFKRNANFFAENCEKSQKIVIITSTPGSCILWHLCYSLFERMRICMHEKF
jgi:hypothetical protein